MDRQCRQRRQRTRREGSWDTGHSAAGCGGGHKSPCLLPPPGSKAGSGVSIPGRQRGLGVLAPQLLVCGHLHLSLEGPDLFQGHVWKAESHSQGMAWHPPPAVTKPGAPVPVPARGSHLQRVSLLEWGAGSTGRVLGPLSLSSPRVQGSVQHAGLQAGGEDSAGSTGSSAGSSGGRGRAGAVVGSVASAVRPVAPPSTGTVCPLPTAPE